MPGVGTHAPPVATVDDSTPAVERAGAMPRAWAVAVGLAVFAIGLFALRLAAPMRFSGNEWRVSAYALDIVHNGRWFSQTDTLGEIASKPPLLMWLTALAALPTGHVGVLALYWPTALATILIAWALLATGRDRFGWRAGFLAAASYLASGVAFDQMRTARYDGVLALLAMLGALAAWRAWRTGRGWTWFWGAGALGTLAKGPLAVILSATGLLAGLWQWRRGGGPAIRGSHRAGLVLYVAVVGGWLALAYWQAGPSLIDKLFERELVAHALGGVGDRPPPRLSEAYRPLWALLIDYAPWSLLTLVGAWRVIARPASDREERAFERFALAWLAADLLLFCAAAHHRARLIYPVVPPAALLAGRELARWTRRVSPARLLGASAVIGVALLVLAAGLARFAGPPDRAAKGTMGAGEVAHRLRALGPGDFPLTYVDPAGPLQVWLSTRRVVVPVDQAARLLIGPAAAFVVVESGSQASWMLANWARDGRVTEVGRWPASGSRQGWILSNHPRLEWPARTATIVGGLRVEMDRARLLRVTDAELVFREEPGGAVSVVNQTARPRTIRVRLAGPGHADVTAVRTLAPGASWRPDAAP
jgi:4-amino-4-deoxy-L-arabinose transferase-like glycosyltransferase